MSPPVTKGTLKWGGVGRRLSQITQVGPNCNHRGPESEGGDVITEQERRLRRGAMGQGPSEESPADFSMLTQQDPFWTSRTVSE